MRFVNWLVSVKYRLFALLILAIILFSIGKLIAVILAIIMAIITTTIVCKYKAMHNSALGVNNLDRVIKQLRQDEQIMQLLRRSLAVANEKNELVSALIAHTENKS